jgi:hypothetical protein
MNQYEALGLSPEQIEGLNRIAAAYTTAGHPTSTDDLMNFAFSPPTMEDPLWKILKGWLVSCRMSSDGMEYGYLGIGISDGGY